VSEQGQPPGKRPLTLANALTSARLILLPVIIGGIVSNHGYLTVGAMGAVIATDLLDGTIARRRGEASPFGQTLDSTVDFVLIYSLFIAFYASGRLATYQFAVIYVAMLTTFLLQLWSLADSDVAGVVRTRSGKVTGALQYAYLVFLVVREVLPGTRAVATADMVLVSSVGCVMRLRRALAGR
jgi:CDP-diacylglycerol--glycerol-3-phosphate 3-phosphatidyltransferase